MPTETSKAEQTAPRERPSRELLKLLGAILCLGAAAYYLVYRYTNPPLPVPPSRLVDVKSMTAPNRELCGPPTLDGTPAVVTMLYSEDMRAWIEDAAERFARGCPNIQVRLTSMGGLEAAEAILAGDIAPTIWAPEDDLILRYLEHRWKEKTGEDLFDIESAKPLVRSPLVVLVWEDRFRVMSAILASQKDSEGPWMKVPCALVPREAQVEELAIEDRVPGRWIDWYAPLLPPPGKKPAPATKKPPVEPKRYQAAFPTLQQIQRWGRVKFVHTSPTHTAGGLEALYLMAYDYALPPKERGAPEAKKEAQSSGEKPAPEGAIIRRPELREAFQREFGERKDALRRWLGRCEAGLESPPRSEELLTEMMFNVGSSRYDGVITYEHLALPLLGEMDEHESSMPTVRVIYPEPTIVNQHPIVHLLPGDPKRKEQHDAADRWINFLRSTEMQRTAVEYSFRPVIPEVTIRGIEEKNLFVDLRRYGVSFEKALEEPPRLDGEAVGELIGIWEDATGRN